MCIHGLSFSIIMLNFVLLCKAKAVWSTKKIQGKVMLMLYHKVNKKEIEITYCKFVLEYQDRELKLTECKITTTRQFLCPS